ncbi:MAG: transporter substrate-binding domain-containing protein [Lachnospiraceae bacterium]|jgi:ABC-type amino acid transport substrate-binding protein|nr:transporter substrate-binding domain-containing protein [Lachnospiraceae bacterium]
MKKSSILYTIVLVLTCVILASCKSKTESADYSAIADLDGKVLGMVETPTTVTIEQINQMMDANLKSVATFPTYNEALMALKSDRVDAINVSKPQAEYTIQTDSSYKYIVGNGKTPIQVSMLTTTNNTELLGQINDAIKALKNSGELDALNEKYIANVSIEAVSLPSVKEGVQTIQVGVSGDMPPFDYLSASGKPSGFNVALMGAIADYAGFNVEFVTVPFSAKFSALLSDRIDVFFFHGGILSQDDVIATDVYYENLEGGLLVKDHS